MVFNKFFVWTVWVASSFLVLWGSMGVSQAQDVYADNHVAPVVALLTDFGWQDAAIGELKGTIITSNPAARLVDISHSITPFNLVQGAFLLDRAASQFPPGTIFVAIVYGHTRNERPPIVLKTKANKYYIAPDDGLISVVAAREGVDHVWVLHDEEKSDKVATESPIDSQGKDLFGTVAGMLSKGETLGNISDDLSPNKLASLSNREPTFIGNTITVQVVSVDRQGNIITNLSKDSEVAAKLKTDTLIKLSAKGQVFSGPLVVDFTDVPRERMALMYGPDKFLQIVQRQGSAARDMNLIPGDSLLLRL